MLVRRECGVERQRSEVGLPTAGRVEYVRPPRSSGSIGGADMSLGGRWASGLLVALAGMLAPHRCWGQSEGSGPVQTEQGRPPTVTEQGATPNAPATLKQTLQVGLKARRPQEFAFISLVVFRVNMGQLDVDLVNQAFDWARKKRTNYKVQYFERALEHLVARDGGVLF